MALKDDGWRLSPAFYPWRATLQTRYSDLDTNAHLNNVAIARLVEDSRVRFHLALRAKLARTDPAGIMIVHAAIDYIGEGEYPEDVASGVAVASIGTSSYRLAIGLFQRSRAFALADCVMVPRAPGGGAGPIDADTRAILEEMHHG